MASNTDARASLTWRNSGSLSIAIKSITQHAVPTLPTPTTFSATSFNSKRSRSTRTDGRRLSRYWAKASWTTAGNSLAVKFAARVIDRGRIVPDHVLSAHLVRELGKIKLESAPLPLLVQALLRPPAGLFIPKRRQKHFAVEAVIPHIQHVHLAVLEHVLAIGPRAGTGCIRTATASPSPLSRHAMTKLAPSRFTSHSHGRGKRLIQIVNVELHPAFRSAKAAEVHQVSIAAALHTDIRWWAWRPGPRPCSAPPRDRR